MRGNVVRLPVANKNVFVGTSRKKSQPPAKLKTTELKSKTKLNLSKIHRLRKNSSEATVMASIESLPYDVGHFVFIPCSRHDATKHQRRFYSINKNNAAHRIYATRYNYSEGGLLVWRMN